jgi:hypothetical protein
MAKTAFHDQGCMVHKPLSLNLTATAASDFYIGTIGMAGLKAVKNHKHSFPNKK